MTLPQRVHPFFFGCCQSDIESVKWSLSTCSLTHGAYHVCSGPLLNSAFATKILGGYYTGRFVFWSASCSFYSSANIHTVFIVLYIDYCSGLVVSPLVQCHHFEDLKGVQWIIYSTMLLVHIPSSLSFFGPSSSQCCVWCLSASSSSQTMI